MTVFEELGKNLTKAGEATVQKAKEVAEFTKINAKILELKGKLDKAYIEVGKQYVAAHPANEEEEMKSVVEAVYELEDQLKELRKQLQDLKGTTSCANCGAECDANAAFCSKCGAELKKEKVVVDVDSADVEDEDAAEETVVEEEVVPEEADVEEVILEDTDIEEEVE